MASADDPSAKKDLELSNTKGRRYQYANYGRGYGYANTYGTVLKTPTYHSNGYNTYNQGNRLFLKPFETISRISHLISNDFIVPKTGYVEYRPVEYRPVVHRPVVQYYGYQKPYVYQQKGYDLEEYEKPKAYKGYKKEQDSEEEKEYEKPKASKGSKKGDDSDEEKDEPKGEEKSKGNKKPKSIKYDDKKKEKKSEAYENSYKVYGADKDHYKSEEYGKYNGYISHSG